MNQENYPQATCLTQEWILTTVKQFNMVLNEKYQTLFLKFKKT